LLENYLGISLSEINEDEKFFINTILKLVLENIDIKKIEKIINIKKKKDEKEKEKEVEAKKNKDTEKNDVNDDDYID